MCVWGPMHRACLTSIDAAAVGEREMADTYDVLVDAAAAALHEPRCTVALMDLHRYLDAYSES